MPDLGPLPKIHPRHEIVSKAETDLFRAIIEWEQRHNLTLAESCMILADMATRHTRYLVNAERNQK